MAKQQKNEQIDELMQKISDSGNFALIKYEKTLHTTLEGLRRELKTSDAKLKIVKNTLLEKAIRRLTSKNKELNDMSKKSFPLKDNTALLSLGEDWSKGLGAFQTYADKEKSISFKMGFLEKKVYEGKQMEKIAKLPPKEQLVAQLIGTMKAPISHFTLALKFNMQKFVYILDAKSKQTS